MCSGDKIKCFLCDKASIKIKNNFSNLNQNKIDNSSILKSYLKNFDSNFHFNQIDIDYLLEFNSYHGKDLINPCRCEKKYHKNCILLNILYSNSLYCEDCFEFYNIKYSEKYNYFNLFISPKYLLNFAISIIMIILLSIAIYIVSENKAFMTETYKEMKIFFILLFLVLNIIFILSAIINCFSMRRNTPPIDIYVEDKDKISYEEELSNRNNIIYENQNSNQNLFTNNINNLSSLNKIDIKNSDKKKTKKNVFRINLKQHNYESAKNYVDYQEFFLNIFHIEIFESKMNFIKRKKLLADKTIEHINIIKELNDDEFQQNILIKFMDFNSCNSSIDEESFKARKNLFIQQIKKNSNNNIQNSIKKKKSEKKIIRKLSIDTPVWQDSENESENEFNYKKLNGINQDPLKKNIKGFKNVKTIRRESSEINNLNTENFNTNINSASGEKFKFSNKDLTGLNVSNIQDYHDNFNNNNDKLILKENTFNHNNKKPSNKILRYNTLSKFTKSSNKDLTSNNSNGNTNLNKMDSEGIDYHNFIVSEEREIGSNLHFKAIPPRSRQSEDKPRLKRKDSKIPSAIFGDFHDFKFRNSTNSSGLNYNNNRHQTFSQMQSPNNSDHNRSNKLKDNNNYNSNINFNSLSNQYDTLNNQNTKISHKNKVVRRNTGYNPKLMKNLSINLTSKNNTYSKNVFQSTEGIVGMNIFSNNIMNDYSLENSYNLQANNLDFKSIKKNLNETGIKKRQRKSSLLDSESNLAIMDKNSNMKFNFGVYEENEINNINQINNSVSTIKRFNKKILTTMSPSKPKKKLTIGSDKKDYKLKQNINILNHSENDLFCNKSRDLYRKILSYSHVGLSLGLKNKLSQDLLNSFESISQEKIDQFKDYNKNKLKNSQNNKSSNNNYGVNNYVAINPTTKYSEEINHKRKSSYLKETQLNTINEDNEIQFKSKKNNDNNVILENHSELNDECYEKNKTINSDELSHFVELRKDNSLNLNDGKDFKNFDTINHMINNGNDLNSRNMTNINTIKNIKNHLMDNIDNIIKEDKSDSYIESSEFSDNSVYKSQHVSLSTDKIINKSKSREKIELIKKRKESANRTIRKFNSTASEKKKMGEFYINDGKNNIKMNKIDFKKSNSYEFPKIVNKFKINNGNEEAKMIVSNNDDDNNHRHENYNNKSKYIIKNKNSYTTNFILSSNFDSLVISESNDEIKNSYIAFNKRSSENNALSELKHSKNDSLYDIDNNQIKKKNEFDDKGYKLNHDLQKHEDITFNNNIDKIDELLDMENLIMSNSSEDVSELENEKIS